MLAAIDRTFAGTGVSLAVSRSLAADAYWRTVDGDETLGSGPATAATIPDLAARATFVTGAAPEGDAEVAVQADAAELLNVRLGDELQINDRPFTVSGTWRAADPLDPRWFGDVTVATGVLADRVGPLAVDESAWARMSTPPTVSYTITPADLAELTPSNSVALRRAWAGAQRAWRGTVPEYESMAVDQDFSRTLDEFAARYLGLVAVEPVAFVLMGTTALVGLSQIVQLLVVSRERESALYWARGQSPQGVARRITAEVGVSATVGALAGVGVVVAVAGAWGRATTLPALAGTAAIVPGVVVVATTALAAIASLRSAQRIASPTRGGRSARRVARAAVPGVVVLVALAAIVSVWQLRIYGSPLVTNATGGTSIDPLAAAAPSAALVAVVLIGLAAFPLVARGVDRASERRGVRAHLAARTLVRDARRVIAPLVVVALAVGSAGVAAAFSATWAGSFSRAAQLSAGADLRASSRFAPILPSQLDAVADTPGVTSVASVDSQILSVGPQRGTTLAATPEAVRTLATTAEGTFDPAAAADAIALEVPGPVVAAGTRALTLRVEATGFASPPVLSGWIVDALGRLHPFDFDLAVAEGDDVFAYAADVDGLVGTLVSIDLDLPAQDVSNQPGFHLVSLDATAADGGESTLALDQFWVVDTLSDQLRSPNASGTGFVLINSLRFLRMTASLDGAGTDVVTPRLVVSEPLARALELSVGDIVVFNLKEAEFRVTGVVSGIVPAVPGARTDDAALIDLSAGIHLRLRSELDPTAPSDLWIATDDPDAVRALIRTELPATTRFDSSTDPVGRQLLGAAPIALAAAALCCLLIAVVAVGSGVRARLRSGRDEIGTLRALGVDARDQSAILVREQLVVLAVAGLTGVVAGAVVAVTTVPQLARAAVDRAALGGDPTLAVDVVALAVALAALALGIAVVLAAAAASVRRIAARALPGEARS